MIYILCHNAENCLPRVVKETKTIEEAVTWLEETSKKDMAKHYDFYPEYSSIATDITIRPSLDLSENPLRKMIKYFNVGFWR